MISAVVMAGALIIFNPALSEWGELPLLAAAAKLFILIAGAVLVYFAVLLALGLRFQHFKVSADND